jgi:hypothetical protein
MFRSAGFNLESAQSAVEYDGLKHASEFGAVYFTSFHLYAERALGSLPPRDWQMLFYDFIALLPFVEQTKYHPQYWYARNYTPQAEVPPVTMGILANSAIWGGEIDLLLRSFLNGAIFALLMRWFLKRSDRWWALTVYVYCYATCVMTLKYSVLFQLTPLAKIMLPTILLTGLLFKMHEIVTLKRA